MTQNYELIVKGIRNFENKVTVTLALRDKTPERPLREWF